MRTRYLVIGVVLILAVVTGVLIYQGKGVDTAGNTTPVTVTVDVTESASAAASTSEPAPTTEPASSSVESSPTSSSESSPSAPVEPGSTSNIPMTKLQPGEKAPQFIIFSFDGAGSHTKWQEFMAAAEPHDARFVGFLTGLYLLTDANKDQYSGPGHSPGKSSVGFGGTNEEVATLIGDLNEAYSRGYEIGTHYNGHFCSGAEPSGNMWSTADWTNELDQFFNFFTNYQTNNPGANLPTLDVPATEVKGGRTQCLEGQWDQLVPAWKAHNFIYDSSMPAPKSGVFWPQQVDGIWEFYMPNVYSPGFGGMVMAMDYNFWIKFNQGKEELSRKDELTQAITATYDHMYNQAYNGNRAPVLIANHFNNWNGNSFNPAVLKFMEEKCGQPETYCATYQDVITWMELQDPAVLADLLAQPAVAAGP